MKKRVKFTREEKEEDYKDVEAMIRENMTYSEIADLLGKSRQYICIIKQDLVKKGILSQNEIDLIKEDAIKDKNDLFDELVLVLLNKGKNIRDICENTGKTYDCVAKAIERLEAKGKYKNQNKIIYEGMLAAIVELINDGKCKTDIANELNIPMTTLKRYIQKLIDDNVIIEEQIVNKVDVQRKLLAERNQEIYKLLDEGMQLDEIAQKYNLSVNTVIQIRHKRGKKNTYNPKVRKDDYDIKEVDLSLLSNMQVDIVELLKKGYSYTYISKKWQISQRELMKVVQELKKEKYLTQAVINKARDDRRNCYLNRILELLKMGYKQVDIYRSINKEIEELPQATISRMIAELVDKELITREQIEENYKKTDESYEKIDEKVLMYLQAGYTVKEIIELDESGYLTESRIRRSKERLIKNGKITEKVIKSNYDKRKARNSGVKQELNEIWNYINSYGYSDAEIASVMDVSVTYIYYKVKEIKEKKKLSDDDLKLLRKEARLKYQNKRNVFIKTLIDEFHGIKEQFKREYEKFYPTLKTQKKYFDVFKLIDSNGITFLKEDIDVLRMIILYEKEFFNNENVEYVISKYLEIGEHFAAETFLNEYLSNISNKNDLIEFKNRILGIIERAKLSGGSEKSVIKKFVL